MSSEVSWLGLNEPQESRVSWKVMNYWCRQVVISGVILIALGGSLNAERVNTVNGSVDLVASADDNPRIDTPGSIPLAPGSSWGLWS